MSDQLLKLARPFPAKYVKKPPSGKFGSYVPIDVVQQALLAYLGPVNIEIGQVFMGESGKVEGCLVTLICVIDAAPVSVTEVGDCENPDNWKTQGARMKDAISDGIKRCAMRIGLGLHLWAQEDYFLFDYLTKQSQSSSGEHSVAANGEGVSSPSPPFLKAAET